jgi:hypothetical protein
MPSGRLDDFIATSSSEDAPDRRSDQPFVSRAVAIEALVSRV